MNSTKNSTPTNRVEHTPGPWLVEPADNDGFTFDIRTPAGHIDPLSRTRWGIASIWHQSGGEIDSSRDEANACLIAAAPDLLDALRTLVLSAHPSRSEHPVMFQAWQRAQAAIAKATGVVLLLFCILSLSACELSKGGSSLLAPDPVEVGSGWHDLRPLSLIIGTWTGHASATKGDSGDLTAIFDTAVDPTKQLTIRLIWFSNAVQMAYRGTASGTLGSLGIVADQDNPPIGTRCGYQANAHLNAAEDTITGSYTGVGAGVCGEKAGTFVLKRQGPPPCVGGATYTFPAQSFLAVFPPGFLNPWYPFSLPAVPFSIPAGTWHFRAVTGSGDSQSDAQIVKFMLYGAGDQLLATVGPTQNVPAIQSTHLSDLGTVTLTQPVLMMKAIHGYTGPPVTVPIHSVYPVSLSYACPVPR